MGCCHQPCDCCDLSCACCIQPSPVQPSAQLQIFTTGPIWRNPNTDIVVVSLLNEDPNVPQPVSVSVLDWQNACNPTEVDKFAFLCGQILNPPVPPDSVQVNNGGILPPAGFLPITTPFTFTIPPRQMLTIHAYPVDPIIPFQQIYEVVIVAPIIPPNPVLPSDPIRRVVFNTFGINTVGEPQVGNGVLNHQFTPTNPIIPPNPV